MSKVDPPNYRVVRLKTGERVLVRRCNGKDDTSGNHYRIAGQQYIEMPADPPGDDATMQPADHLGASTTTPQPTEDTGYRSRKFLLTVS